MIKLHIEQRGLNAVHLTIESGEQIPAFAVVAMISQAADRFRDATVIGQQRPAGTEGADHFGGIEADTRCDSIAAWSFAMTRGSQSLRSVLDDGNAGFFSGAAYTIEILQL